MAREIEVGLSEMARAYLEEHPGVAGSITYETHHCCGGGKICGVRVRARTQMSGEVVARLDGGEEIFLDERAAARLPERFNLMVRGWGWFRHLDLDLSGEQWGTLLYD